MNQIRGVARKVSTASDVLPFDKIPGPRGIFGIGNFYNYIKPFGEFLLQSAEIFLQLVNSLGKYDFDNFFESGMSKYEEFGPIVCERMVPGVSVVFIYEPNDIAEIYKEGSSEFPRRRSHLALDQYRKDRPEIYRTSGLLPT